MNGKRALMVAIVVVAVVCGTAVRGVKAQSGATPHGTGMPAGQGGEKKADEQFKNIQVLKGVPADQIFPTMQFIAVSLGVECEYCHTPPDFDKDDKKPKQTARKMMQMMFAINKDTFEGNRKVTCFSCHRGSTDPVAIPPVMTEVEAKTLVGTPPKPGEPKKAEMTPEQLLDKYIQAAGGTAAIEKISSRVMKGTIDFGGRSVPIDIYAKDPEQRISFAHMPEGDSVTAFNGHEGWLGMPGGRLREMRGSDLDGAAIDADLHLATHLKQMFTEMGARGTDKVGDRDAYVVVGQRDGKPPIRLYFDAETGLLVRLVRYGETALGRMPTQIDYADYREADGVKIPYRWTLARPSGRFTIQVSEARQNVPVDDAKFTKPASPGKGPGM